MLSGNRSGMGSTVEGGRKRELYGDEQMYLLIVVVSVWIWIYTCDTIVRNTYPQEKHHF